MVNLGIPKIKENSRIMKQNYDPPSIEKKSSSFKWEMAWSKWHCWAWIISKEIYCFIIVHVHRRWFLVYWCCCGKKQQMNKDISYCHILPLNTNHFGSELLSNSFLAGPWFSLTFSDDAISRFDFCKRRSENGKSSTQRVCEFRPSGM